jgi:hypothetical protein
MQVERRIEGQGDYWWPCAMMLVSLLALLQPASLIYHCKSCAAIMQVERRLKEKEDKKSGKDNKKGSHRKKEDDPLSLTSHKSKAEDEGEEEDAADREQMLSVIGCTFKVGVYEMNERRLVTSHKLVLQTCTCRICLYLVQISCSNQ